MRLVSSQRQLTPSGRKFNRLTIIGEPFYLRFNAFHASEQYAVAQCDCGVLRIVPCCRVAKGISQSCGRCVRRTLAADHRKEYQIWHEMISRCTNEANKHWHNYGGRGIAVCKRWMDSFEAFFQDMGPCPAPGYSIDRYPNNDGNYESGNCRWATQRQQCNNTRRNRRFTFNGHTSTIAEWARALGRTPGAMYYQLHHYPSDIVLSRDFSNTLKGELNVD